MSLSTGVRFRLSTMMFLLYVIWGAYGAVSYPYFKTMLGFDDWSVGLLMSIGSLAAIVSPFIGGQIADRWFPTQWFLAISGLAGAALLYLMGVVRDATTMIILMAAYSLLFAPMLPLTNSLAFHHLKDPDREFGGIRVWGTIGWVVAGLALMFWRQTCNPAFKELFANFSLSGDWVAQLWAIWWKPEGTCVLGDLFFLGAASAVVFGLFCFFLPHTPPKREGVNPLAFVEALKLLKDRNFLIFLGIAFVVTTELNFYYIPTPSFLADIGIAEANVPAVMTIAQLAEIIVLAFLLPPAVKRIGLRWTLALGVIAWPLRYIFFAIGEPTWLVVAALAFHGFGYAFFFVASQIYVNNVAHGDIRASAQSLLTLVTVGIGMWLGAMIFTFIKIICTTGALPPDTYTWMAPVYDSLRHLIGTDVAGKAMTRWGYLFVVPCALTSACALAYLLFFRPAAEQLKAEKVPT